MKEIIIDRSQWRTGGSGKNSTGEGEVQLLNEKGYKCCLGFITLAYKKKASDHYCPGDVGCSIPHLTTKTDFGRYTNSELAGQAIAINDDHDTTPQEKEKAIKKLFKGVFNLKFVGKFKKPAQV